MPSSTSARAHVSSSIASSASRERRLPRREVAARVLEPRAEHAPEELGGDLVVLLVRLLDPLRDRCAAQLAARRRAGVRHRRARSRASRRAQLTLMARRRSPSGTRSITMPPSGTRARTHSCGAGTRDRRRRGSGASLLRRRDARSRRGSRGGSAPARGARPSRTVPRARRARSRTRSATGRSSSGAASSARGRCRGRDRDCSSARKRASCRSAFPSSAAPPPRPRLRSTRAARGRRAQLKEAARNGIERTAASSACAWKKTKKRLCSPPRSRQRARSSW